MSQYSAIKAAVNAYIKQNGRKEITGNILNSVLNAVIDSLGKFYQFAGVALPSTDPEDPDQNVCYLAGEPGTYVHFDNIVLENEEIALLFWNGEWTKQRMLLGIQEVEASVDDQVGTPSVDVSYSNGRLILTFHNIKGDPGETGAAAGFGTIGASVDSNIGTPSVSVETSGDNTAKNLMFRFSNLKGETGVTSVVATVDNTSGTPSCTVSLVGQQLTLAFSGLKGLQGDTGVSADYPITIANNLTTNDPTSALSAAMGVQLESEISQLEAEVDELDEELHEINPHITGRMGIGNTNTDITTSTLPEYTDQYGIATLVLDSPGYLWVCLENESFRVTSGGIEIPIVYVKDDGGLHCYVSAEMVNAGTLQFKVESIHPIKSDTERLTITARSYTITYGDAIPELGYTANGEVEGTPAITCEAVQGSDSGTYAIHIARGTVTDSNAIFVDGILTIEKAELTVTADDKFVELNGTMPTFTMQYSGFVLGEDESDLDTVPTCITDAEDTATAGAYTITPGGGVSDNYTFVYVPGILRVGVTTLLSWTAAELFAGKSVGGYIDVATNKKKTSTNYWGIVINVDGLQGKTVKFTKHYSFFRFAFMKSCGAWTNGGTISFSDATGYTAQVESNADTLSVEIPADTKYIYVYTTYNQNTNTAPDIEITGTAETSKTILLAASLFTANKTIGSNGTVYTGNDAKTVFCTIDPLRVETYSFLHDVAVTLANMPAAYDLMAFAVAQYTASNKFIKRVGYTDIPDSIELDPAADTFHLMMFGSLNGDQVEISSVPIGDNDIQLTVIDN